MAVAKKKPRPNSGKNPVPGKKVAKKKKSGRPWSRVKQVCIGVDTSLYSISLAGIAETKNGETRAGAIAKRWEKTDDYFTKINDAAHGETLLHDLFLHMKIEPELDQVYISIEEPVSIGHLQRSHSMHMKQQIEIEGALLGSMFRWGWKQVWQIQAQQWQSVVAADLGITTHHSKWNPTKREGKFRAKDWIKQFHPEWDGEWPDIIQHSKRGMIPRPGDSKARGQQSDDRYEALAMAEFQRRQI